MIGCYFCQVNYICIINTWRCWVQCIHFLNLFLKFSWPWLRTNRVFTNNTLPSSIKLWRVEKVSCGVLGNYKLTAEILAIPLLAVSFHRWPDSPNMASSHWDYNIHVEVCASILSTKWLVSTHCYFTWLNHTSITLPF